MVNKSTVSDDKILKYNNLGLSLKAMGTLLNLHPTSVRERITRLGSTPADTRRSFADEVFDQLPEHVREHLLQSVMPDMSLKTFVVHLITDHFVNKVQHHPQPENQ